MLQTLLYGSFNVASRQGLSKKRSRVQLRQGTAATEAAILLPVFVLTVFASIEFANALYLKQSLTLAAYEATTVLEEKTGTTTKAEDRCEEILASRDVHAFEMDVSPDPDDLDPGDVFTITVASPASAYRFGPSFFLRFSTIRASVSSVRQ